MRKSFIIPLVVCFFFWAGVQYEQLRKTSDSADTVELSKSIQNLYASYEEDITGKWSPVEMAEGTLTFQYGFASITRSLGEEGMSIGSILIPLKIIIYS